MIKWLFFDVGNVILNDDPAMARLYKYIYDLIEQNGKRITFEEILSHRENSILQNRDGNHYDTVAKKYLGEEIWRRQAKSIKKKLSDNWKELSPLMPGAASLISSVEKNFNLGLIANQPKQAVFILEDYQLLQYFRVNCISAVVGLRKPDFQIFEYALKKAGCQPEESLMIGDRVDNDIKPAKALGMKTVWFKLPLTEKGYHPADGYEKLYFESIAKASASQLSPQSENEQADFVAESFNDLHILLQRLVEKKNIN